MANEGIQFCLLAVIVLVVAAADLWIHIHRQQLSAFDQLRIGVCLVHLHVQEKPAFAEDVFRVDNTGGFLVVG